MTTDYPYTTNTVVPVYCTTCGEDMTFTVENFDAEHRHWLFTCVTCGRLDEEQYQKREHLFATCGGIPNVYIGSYWAHDVESPYDRKVSRV